MEKRKVRYGIISTAGIAPRFIKASLNTDNSVFTAVASRDLAKAQEFARNNGLEKAYEDRLKSNGSQTGAGAVRALEICIFDKGQRYVFRTDRPIIFGNFAENIFVAFIFKRGFNDLAFDGGSISKSSIPGGPLSVRGSRGTAEDQDKQYSKNQ